MSVPQLHRALRQRCHFPVYDTRLSGRDAVALVVSIQQRSTPLQCPHCYFHPNTTIGHPFVMPRPL